MSATTTPIQLTAESQEALFRLLNEMKTQYGEFKTALDTGKPVGEIKTKIDKIDGDLVEFRAKFTDAIARMDAFDRQMKESAAKLEPPKSLGDLVIADAGLLAAIKDGGRMNVTVRVKGPLHKLGQKDITGLSQTWPQMLSDVIGGPRLTYGVRNLVPQGRTTAGALEFIEETSFTNNAAPVAEGAPKPKSDKVFTLKTNVVRTIAHYFKVSRQTFDDLPAVAAMIESNGIYGVKLVEDNQLLNGGGVPPNLQGFMSIATAAPAPPATGSTLVDAIGTAVFDLATKGWIADGTVANPADWGGVAMMKNAQGNYIFANPLDYTSGGRIWGTRLQLSANMAAGNFLTGQFQGGAQIFDREDVSVQVATQNEDDFIKNMLTILVEERLALVVYQPSAFEKGVTPALAAQGRTV